MVIFTRASELSLFNYKYKGRPMPTKSVLRDVNNDNEIDILDVIYLINYKYKGGSLPNCPQQG
jgi:hypothetical protein